MEKHRTTYSIGDAAEITGVSQKQIRNWEACGYIPKAERIVCGERAYRRFTQDQVNVIREIKEYLDQGYTLAHASKLALNKERRGSVKNA
jgi:DNA-binding transcriptional MerR regulator